MKYDIIDTSPTAPNWGLHPDKHVARTPQHLRDLFRGLLTEAVKIGYIGNDVAPDELASYLPVRPDSRQQSAVQCSGSPSRHGTLAGLRPIIVKPDAGPVLRVQGAVGSILKRSGRAVLTYLIALPAVILKIRIRWTGSVVCRASSRMRRSTRGCRAEMSRGANMPSMPLLLIGLVKIDCWLLADEQVAVGAQRSVPPADPIGDKAEGEFVENNGTSSVVAAGRQATVASIKVGEL
jgi:hypothetical protein